MTAKLILPHDADRDEWLEARRHGVTASEIAAVMGLSPYESPLSLYHRKRGELGEQADNDAMSLGRYLEGWVAARFAERHPEFHVAPGGLFAHETRSWQMATPDRRLFEICGGAYTNYLGHTMSWAEADGRDPVSLLELKTDASYDGWGDDGSDDIPVHYRAQVLWQLDVFGLTEARVACLFLHSRQTRVYVIARDDAAERDLKIMRDEAAEFLDNVDLGTPPPIDSHPATTETLKALHPDVEDREVEIGRQLAQRYRSACRKAKAADERKTYYANRILAAVGNGRRAVCDDRTVATRSVFERKGYYVQPTTVNQIRPAKESK